MTRPQKTKTTFLGPVIKVREHGGHHFVFRILQPAGGTLELSYKSWEEAVGQREALCKNPQSLKVPSLPLFCAIQTALQEQQDHSFQDGFVQGQQGQTYDPAPSDPACMGDLPNTELAPDCGEKPLILPRHVNPIEHVPKGTEAEDIDPL